MKKNEAIHILHYLRGWACNTPTPETSYDRGYVQCRKDALALIDEQIKRLENEKD